MSGDVVLGFRVEGTPVPQGSARAFLVAGRAKVAPSNSNALKPWRKAVTKAAIERVIEVGQDAPAEGPLKVFLRFELARPKTVAREFPTVAPDLDKLVRAVLDGMTDAGVYVDDSQVCQIVTSKEYGVPGVHVLVSRMGVSAGGPQGVMKGSI